ncbi:class I SAM-dependent methyltransferase [Streptomyces silaceus]|uniref:class I SAM-dependent methyltransferase n=1 Tax=Streptomyces silaceus TaxID=545123 RepID=UPI0006EBB8D8|nr:class I SAM-dependent methyltransferase [Streptomyces silaceus]
MGHHHGHGHGEGQGQGHGHGHSHDDMDWITMAGRLERYARIAAPMYGEVTDWLRRWVPEPGVVADIGSGPGAVSVLLAQAFPKARIIAADPEAELLERAREHAAAEGLADRFATVRAALPDDIGGVPRADLLWLCKSLHHVGDQGAALSALADHLAPGGAIALLEGGLNARSLPRDIGFGRPGLLARLEASDESWFNGMRAGLDGSTDATEDWPALLKAAGLRYEATRSFLLDLPAPVSDDTRAHLVEEFTLRREMHAERIDPEDLATFDRLLDADDPQSLHRRPDLFLLTAQTVHVAVKEA